MATRDSSYLLDIYESARFVREFVEGMDFGAFMGDRRTRSAVICEILLIGEATKRISNEFRCFRQWTINGTTRGPSDDA